MRQQKPQQTPDNREEGVTITEVPADDQVTTVVTQRSLAIVTQPDDKSDTRKQTEEEEQEEELIIIEKTKEGKVTRQKKKKIVRQESEEEIEIEIEIVGGGKRKVKKTIKAIRPDTEEETITEEYTEELKPLPDTSLKGLPLISTPSQVSESIPTARTTEILTGGKLAEEHVKVSLLTHTAVSEQEVRAEEHEEETIRGLKPEGARAAPTLDTIQPYQVTEPDIQTQTGEFQTTFKPQTFEARKTFVPSEGIIVSEITTENNTGNISTRLEVQKTQATFSMTLKEATSVTEMQVSLKEGDVQHDKVPQSRQATTGVVPQEGLSVTEVNEGQSEDKLDILSKPTSVKPRVEVPSSESLVISEVFAETKPGKYYPELFVATEVATKSVITQQQVTVQETHAPETEGEYFPGRLPQSQQAEFAITPGETLQVSETRIQEKEGDLVIQRKPDTFHATQDLTVLEGVAVRQVESQQPQSEFTIEEKEEKRAEVEFSERECLITVVTTIGEKEGKFAPGDKPQGKQAGTSITCLETSGISWPIVQESEGELLPLRTPVGAYAEPSLRPEESISVSEIQAESVPSEFSDVLKYRTDEATINIETQEAKQVSQTLTQEREEIMESKDIPQVFTVEQEFTPQSGLSVTQTEINEKEGDFKPGDLPESHKVKAAPTHPLHSLVVEETLAEGFASQLKKDKPQTGVAKLGQDLFQETVIEETVLGEGLKTHKLGSQPDRKLADVIVLEEEGVTVTEVITQDKESSYTQPEQQSECFANPDFATQKVAIKSEVLPEYVTGPLIEEAPTKGVAKSKQTTMESLLITLAQMVEKEGEFQKDFRPDTKEANMEWTDSMSGISVTQVTTHERESEYVTEETPKEISATPSVPGREIALKSETLPELHLGKLVQEEPVHGRAKRDNEPYQELVVTETAITEVEKLLEKDLKPEEKKADITVDAGESISVTEIVAEHKETILEALEMPKQRKAILDILSREVAQKVEVVADDYINILKQLVMKEAKAYPEQEALECATMLHPTLGEREGEYIREIKPEQKQADVTFEEGQVISVTEITIEDKEHPMVTPQAPKKEKATSAITAQGVAISSEVIADLSIEEITPQKPLIAEARYEQIPYQSIILSETNIRESESEYKSDITPQAKKAETAFEEGQSITTTIITIEDKERELLTQEEPKKQSAVPEIIGQEVAEKSEVVIESSVAQLLRESPERGQATAQQSPYVSIIQSETAPGETEGELKHDIKPEKKSADITFEEGKGVSVTEVICQDKEGKYTIPDQPEGKFAKPDVIGHEVAQKIEVVTESRTGEVMIEQPNKIKATSEQLPFESIVLSETSVQESEGEFQGKLKLDLKSAELAFEEGRSVTVTQVNLDDKETIFVAPIKQKERIAHPDITSQEVAQKSEVFTEIGIGHIPKEAIASAKALPEQVPFESIVQTEATIREHEGDFSEFITPHSKKAELLFEEGRSVTIISTIAGDTESEYVTPVKPKERIARPDILGHEVAEKSEIVAGMRVNEFIQEALTSAHAITEQMPYESLVHIEHAVNEREGEFSGDKIPSVRRADLDFEIEHSVTVSQVTLGDKELAYNAPLLPKERKALPDISESQEVAEQSQTIAQHSVKEINELKPILEQAHPEQETLQSIFVSEGLAQEQESEFSGKFKPTTRNVEIVIEEGKRVQTVSEVLVEDKEGKLDVMEIPRGKKAQTDISGHEVAEKLEIHTELCVGDMLTTTEHRMTANLQQMPFESLVQTETIVRESEEELKSDLRMISKSAEMTFEEGRSITVTQIVSEDKEETYTSPEKPKGRIAQPEITGKEVAEKTEVLTEMGVTELLSVIPTSAQALSESVPFVGLTLTEVTVREREEDFTGTFKPNTKSADIAFEEGIGVTITEVVTQDKEGTYIAPERPTGKLAEAEISAQEVAQKSEVITGVSIGEFIPESVHTMTANLNQLPFESIIQTEETVQEHEGDLKEGLRGVKKSAEMTFEEGRSVSITQVTVEDKEGILQPEEFPKKITAQSEILSQESLQQSEVLTEMHVGVVKHAAPTQEKAHHEQDIVESIIISQGIVHEQEGVFNESFKPTGNQAQIEFEEKKVITISEVTLQDKEGNYVMPEVPKERTALPDITPQEIAQKSEVIAEFGLTEFTSTAPNTAYAKLGQVPLESIIQTQTNISEQEEHFIGTFRPDTKSAELAFEKAKKVVTISQIVTEDKEGECTGIDIPKKQVASTEVSGQEAYEQTEVVTSLSTGKIVSDIIPTKVQAIPEQLPYESISLTETSVQESEGILKLGAKPETTNAELRFREERSINVTEVIAQDKEATKITAGVAIQGVAQPDVVGQEVALKTEILPENELGCLDIEFPSPSVAKQAMPQQLHSLVVSEVQTTGEVESDLAELLKPASKRVSVSLEEQETRLLITEVQPEDREGEYEVVSSRSEHYGVLNLVSCRALTQEETIADTNINTFESTTDQTQSQHANVTHSTNKNTAVVLEVTSGEQEGTLDIINIPHNKTADIHFEGTRSEVIVEETTLHEKELELILDSRSGSHAMASFVPNKTTIVEETKPAEILGILSVLKPNEQVVHFSRDVQESIVVTEMNVNEGEKPLNKDSLQSKSTAEITFMPNKGVSITETITQQTVGDLAKTLEVNKFTANLDLTLQEAPIVQEPIAGDTVGVLTVSEKNEAKYAESELILEKTLSTQELVVQEDIVDIGVDITKLKETHAKDSYTTVEAISTNETIVEQTVPDFEIKDKHRETQTSSKLLTSDAIEIFESKFEENAESIKETLKPNEYNAKSRYILNDTTMTEEIILQEESEKLAIKMRGKESKAVLGTDATSVAIKEQIITDESTSEMPTSVSAKETQGQTDVVAREVAMKEEAIIHEETSDLKKSILAKEITAKTDIEGRNVATTEESIIQEEVTVLPDTILAKESQAKLNIIARKAAITEQPTTQEGTSDLPEAVLAKESQAKPDIVAREAAITEQPTTQEGTSDLPEAVLAKESQAKPDIVARETAITEQPTTQEGTSDLPEAVLAKESQAKPDIVAREAAITEQTNHPGRNVRLARRSIS
uniref:(California timema) hypothetical protein n=1 Tax=Timema californicum TaxID=61474 RepID=A0A7R9P549_TIMCA|nr:unnamed protein product [Timema californicum]